jgi:hypothetical protein
MAKQILRIETVSSMRLFGLGEGRPGSVELVKHGPDDQCVELCVIEAETKNAATVLLDRNGLEQLGIAAGRMRQGM